LTTSEIAAADPSDRGIELENAVVGELFIYRPVALSDVRGNGFPRPVNLRGLTVTSWRLEHGIAGDQPGRRVALAGSREPSESNQSGPYLDLLDNDGEYRASTYLSIEKALRDRGHDRAAREVFAAGRYREHRTDFAYSNRFPWRPGHGRRRTESFSRKIFFSEDIFFEVASPGPEVISETNPVPAGTEVCPVDMPHDEAALGNR